MANPTVGKGGFGQRSEHFNFGHFGAVALCAVALLFTTWLKNGFSLSDRTSATAPGPVLTYEQARAEVAADQNSNQAQSPGNSKQTAEDLATLDPNSYGGSVLGTSTDAEMFPPADQMLTPAMLDQIKINTIDATGSTTISQYSRDLTYVESQSNTLGLVADLNSGDAATLKKVEDNAKNVVANLAKIPVPKELAEYHKIKMMYFTTLGFMARGFAGDQSVGMDNLSTIMFSLSEKLDQTESDIYNKYGVQL
ncbi:MAG: hypothetical protein KGJ93_00405 [Patescibacteria group bacterium]|nr:hypothetical protein [Patescibacteria group bacterium]